MRGTGWRMLWLGVALMGLVGCMTTPPDPKPPPRPDELVEPPKDDPRVADPRAAYPPETMNRTDAMQNRGGSLLQNGTKGGGRPGGMGAPGGGPGFGPGGY